MEHSALQSPQMPLLLLLRAGTAKRRCEALEFAAGEMKSELHSIAIEQLALNSERLRDLRGSRKGIYCGPTTVTEMSLVSLLWIVGMLTWMG